MSTRVLVGAAAILLAQGIGAAEPQHGDWSAPVPFAPANTAGRESPNGVSPDGLALYFQRGDVLATAPEEREDIWVVRRPHPFARWGEPERLSDDVNSGFNERGARLSPDGHWMVFASDRPGGRGGFDLMVSWRLSVRHDVGPFGWRPARNLDELGAAVNTAGFDSGPTLFRDRRGAVHLYFVSNPAGSQAQADIYETVLGPDGRFMTPSLVPELSSPVSEGSPSLGRDGLEIYFQSNRPGGVGGFDIWRATREAIDEPWSVPENVTAVNTADNDFTPVLSWGGSTLFLGYERLGARDGDVLVSVRHPSRR